MPAYYGSRKYDPLGIDPDARRYIAQSGARDRNNINRFVRGVKSLGLWSSMVCWPLRSSQNAGTGTTVFSLGGNRTANGTLVNGPTWGADFMTYGNGAQMTVPISKSGVTALTSLVACNIVSGTGNDAFFSLDAFTLINTINCIFSHNYNVPTTQNSLSENALTAGPGTTRSWGTQSLAANSLNVWAAGRPDITVIGTGFNQRNGVRYTNTAGTGVKPRTADGAETGFFARSIGENRAVFASLFMAELSETQVNAVRDLLRNTLAQGLGLP